MQRKILFASALLLVIAIGIFLYSGKEHTHSTAQENPELSRTRVNSTNPEIPEGLAKALKLRDKRNEYLRQSGVIGDGSNSSMSLVSPEGLINREVLRDAGVAEEKLPEIQAQLDTLVQTAEATITKNIIPDPAKSDTEKGIQAYLLKGDPQIADQAKAAFQDSIYRIAGPSSAKQILASFHPNLLMAGLGRFNASVIFTTTKVNDQLETQVSFSLSEPTYGYPVATVQTSDKEISKYFGRAFDFVK